MPEQVLIQFNTDRELKDTCADILGTIGIDLNTAFRMFMERTKAVKGLPFPLITSEEALSVFHELREDARDVPEMTMEEIDAEIKAVREEKRTKKCLITQ